MFPTFIKTSTTGVKQTFGKFTGIVKPGLNWYVPFVQTIIPVSNRLQQSTFDFEVKTKDNVFARLNLAVQYKIYPENTEKAYFSLDNPINQIDAYIENVVRSKVPGMTIDALFESQDDICQRVSESLCEKMERYGYTIENTLVTNIEPSKDVKEAMNRINATERMKAAAKNEAEANKIMVVKQAEADRDRKILQGEGMSGQRLAILQGYEVGVGQMATKLNVTAKDVIDFVLKTQHLDTVEAIGRSDNAKTIFYGHDPSTVNSATNANRVKDAFIQARES
jgi:regulator of protease activity HflC (stomatin/prohibitin superfamily)